MSCREGNPFPETGPAEQRATQRRSRGHTVRGSCVFLWFAFFRRPVLFRPKRHYFQAVASSWIATTYRCWPCSIFSTSVTRTIVSGTVLIGRPTPIP